MNFADASAIWEEMLMSKPIYVIGHRNPDTDSICSAIGYAYLQKSLGREAVPARAGKVNNETKYILETLGVEAPVLVNDLYPRVKDVMKTWPAVISPKATIRELGQLLKDKAVKSVPVVDEENNLLGIVSTGDLAKRYFEELQMQDLSEAHVTYEAAIRTLEGRVVVGSQLERLITGKVKIAAAKVDTMISSLAKGDTLLVGDRRTAQLKCIQQGIACLVVTGNAQVSDEVFEAAQAADVILIVSPHDTYTCARLLNQTMPVRSIMQSQVVAFKDSDFVMDIKKTLVETKFRDYPVTQQGKFVGMLDRDNLIVPEQEQVILVDHNELVQAVEGIGEAKIIEVIDHHRFGGLQTDDPIFIHVEPVGCTGTIVANAFFDKKVDMPPKIAGLLLSAIISDTVLFKSPTCTPKDKATAEKLAVLAGLNIQEHGMALLKAGASISSMTAAEMMKNDTKEFQVGDYRFAIGQISVMDPQEVMDRKAELLAAMQDMREKDGYHMVILMDTDILNEATHLIYDGEPKDLIAAAFGSLGEDQVVYLPGVMSRKKQIVPPLSEAGRK